MVKTQINGHVNIQNERLYENLINLKIIRKRFTIGVCMKRMRDFSFRLESFFSRKMGRDQVEKNSEKNFTSGLRTNHLMKV